MAKLNVSLSAVKYNFKSSENEYQGISRKYFPKWEGWSILDFGGTPSEYMVDEFYREFFWSKLMADGINSQSIADLILAFSVISGKKKAISKLQRVLNTEITGILSISDIRKLNKADTCYTFLGLFAEFIEFYVSVKTPERIKPLLSVYYKFLQNQ